jgi:hypothetical protein
MAANPNPHLETIRLLNLSAADSQGDFAWLYLLLRALGDGFDDAGNNVHVRNMPKECLRRLTLLDSTNGHGIQRLSALLTPAAIAFDSK